MASYNRVILVGNITRDLELRYVSNGGIAVTELGLAVNDRRKTQSGEWIDETTFVDVTLWGRTAEIANQYLSKGSPVLIEGRLKLDTWETAGQKRSKLRVVGEKMQMLGGKGESSGGGGGRSSAPRQRGPQNSSSDDGYDSQAGNSQDGGDYGGGYDSPGGGGSGRSEDDIPF